jgi:hypothetical protein
MKFSRRYLAPIATSAVFVLVSMGFSGCGNDLQTPQAQPNISKTSAAASAVSNPTIVVNASQDLSVSGRDDLAVFRAMFQSATRPESSVSNGNSGGGMGSTAAFTQRIGMRQFRAINVEDGCKLDTQASFVLCDRLRWPLDDAQARGYKPHIVVGLLKPSFIAGDAWQWDDARWKLYKDYAYKLVRYVAAEHGGMGFPAVDFEPTNEWDINLEPGHVWTLPGTANAIPQFDKRRYEAFLTIYRVWAEAVDRVHREFPDKVLRVGGPASGWGTQVADGELWHEKIIREVKNTGLRVDFITYHYYGDSGAVGNGRIGSNPVPPLRDQMARIETALASAGLSRAVALTEWGPVCCNDPVGAARINYDHVGAAWASAFLLDAVAGGADEGTYLLYRDNNGTENTGVLEQISLTHLRDGIEHPKPLFNTLRMYVSLPGVRKAVTVSPSQPSIGAVAAANIEAAAIVVHNYNYEFDYTKKIFADRSVDETVSLRFDNLPFSGPVQIERYLIDANTSNLAQFVDAGQTPDLAKTELELAERLTGNVNNGQLNLEARTLGKSAVSFWFIKKI